jgi:predicted RNase H-like HicB family nuclease
MNELVFEVTQEADGGFVAECLSESIFTQADTWEELRHNVQEATSAFFYDGSKPTMIRLHLVRDEVLACA